MAGDVPDWQKTVKLIPAGSSIVPGSDVPDWQKVVKVVTTAQAGQDWPDWQRTIIGPGGANPCPSLPWNGYVPVSGPSGTGPEYWWKMAEHTGTTTAADSVDTNPGTYNGGYSLQQPGIIPSSSDPCPAFDGATGYMQATGTSVPLISPGVSLVIAMQSTASPGPLYGVCGLASTTAFTDMSMLVGGSGYINMGSDDGSGLFHFVTSSTSVLDGAPHLLGFTFSASGAGGTFTAYLDGVTFGNFTLTGLTTPGAPLATCGWASLGVNGIPHFFPGKLQSFLVYNEVLTGANMATLYTYFLT